MVIKRGLLYLIRNNKRSLLLYALLLVISATALIGVAVLRSVDSSITEIKNRLGTGFVIKSTPSPDSAKFETIELDNGVAVQVYTGPTVNQLLVDAVLDIEGIAAYNAENYTRACAENILLEGGTFGYTLMMLNKEPDYLDQTTLTPEQSKMWAECTLISGNSDSELFQYFRTGSFSLIEGRHLNKNDKGKAVISEKLTELNNLQIGDKMNLTIPDLIRGYGDDLKIMDEREVEIVGVFRMNGSQTINEFVAEWDILNNWILTDNDTVEFLEYFNLIERSVEYSNVTFFVEDPDRIADIVDKVTRLDIYDYTNNTISIDDTAYKETIAPLKMVRTIILATILLVSAGGCWTIALLFTMWVKMRKKEIGIYLSVGLHKITIVGQLFAEGLFIALLALLSSLVFMRTVPDAVGNYLLNRSLPEAAVETVVSDEELLDSIFSGTSNELFAYQEEYQGPTEVTIKITVKDLLILVGVEVLVILISIINAGRFVFKYQPRQIFTDISN